jgi:15-cis-phytoene synthase
MAVAHPLLAELRDLDRDRYFALLFAPPDKRTALASLYRFSAEISRIRDVVSDPLPGEIRLQWWRDVLNGERAGEAAANPVASGLLDACKANRLPIAPLIALIDAHAFDLYSDPMPDWQTLEAYCGETVSSLIQLSCLILAPDRAANAANAAGHAGVAVGLAGILRKLPWHLQRGQCFLPRSVLEEHGIDWQNPSTERTALLPVIAAVRGHAQNHAMQARTQGSALSPALLPAFRSLSLVHAYLNATSAKYYDPRRTLIDPSDLTRLWLLWRFSF